MKTADARAQKSRQALLDAGIELLSRNPQASLSEIALKAGVGRATLYRHFETREQLVQILAKDCLDASHAACEPLYSEGLKGREALERMLVLVMPLADKYHFLLNLWGIVEGDPVIDQIYNEQLSSVMKLVEQAKSQGDVRMEISTSWIVALIDSLIYTGWYMMGTEGMSEEMASEHAIQCLFNGICTK